jgi:FdhE protein
VSDLVSLGGGGGGIASVVAWLRPPGDAAALFARRAARLDELAAGHAAADWLTMLARLCAAQASAATALAATSGAVTNGAASNGAASNGAASNGAATSRAATSDVASSGAATSARAIPAGATPLAFASWPRDPSWRQALAILVEQMQGQALPPPARAALAELAAAPAAQLERWADALFADGAPRPDAAAAPFVAAALQTWFTTLAGGVKVAAVARPTGAGCPVCGFPPVAGTVQGDDKVRYLCCGLCASEWHVTRVQCATCRSTAGISYYAIDGAAAGVKAEACASCRSYVKLFYREERPAAEPLADDAATLALDLLLGEADYAQGGLNPLVLG